MSNKSNPNFFPVNKVCKDVLEKMLHVAFSDLKVCTGFFNYLELRDKVIDYLLSAYGLDESYKYAVSSRINDPNNVDTITNDN